MNFTYPPKVVEHDEMKVSIILCTHRSERYEDFVEALDSLNAQSCENEKLEIVVVVDGNRELYDRILKIGIDAFRGEMGVKRKKAHKVVNLVRK